MDIERIKPEFPKKLTSHEALARACWNLAELASYGRWKYREVRNTQLSRSITERVEFPEVVIPEDAFFDQPDEDKEPVEIEPIDTETQIEFIADRTELELEGQYEGDITYDLVEYHIISTVREDILQDEVPIAVLRNMYTDQFGGDDNDEDEDEVTGVLAEANYQDTSNMVIDPDMLSDFIISREQATEYVVDNHGNVLTMVVTYTYYLDDEPVVMNDYGDPNDEPLKQVVFADNVMVDEKPLDLTPISEEEITRDMAKLDEEIFLEGVTEELKLGGQSEEVHRTRIINILGLFSLGLLTRKQLFAKV